MLQAEELYCDSCANSTVFYAECAKALTAGNPETIPGCSPLAVAEAPAMSICTMPPVKPPVAECATDTFCKQCVQSPFNETKCALYVFFSAICPPSVCAHCHQRRCNLSAQCLCPLSPGALQSFPRFMERSSTGPTRTASLVTARPTSTHRTSRGRSMGPLPCIRLGLLSPLHPQRPPHLQGHVLIQQGSS